ALHGGPWTRLGEGGQGEAGLSSRLAAGTWIGAAGSSLLAGPQRRIALQQGLRLGAGSPDGVHPRMAPGVPLRLVGPLQQVQQEGRQLRGQGVLTAAAHVAINMIKRLVRGGGRRRWRLDGCAPSSSGDESAATSARL